MPDTSQLVAFVIASAVLGITPGPDIIYVITRGAAQGARAGVAAAAGLTTGVIGHTAFTVIGLSAILATSAIAFTVIKIAGAAYLIYLGIRMWRSSGVIDLSSDTDARSIGAIYRQTIAMNLLNPKVALFFLAFLPQFVNPSAGPVAPQFALLGLLFMIVAFIVMSTAGFAGAQIRRFLVRSTTAARWVQRAAGTILIALGISLAFQRQA